MQVYQGVQSGARSPCLAVPGQLRDQAGEPADRRISERQDRQDWRIRSRR